MYYEVENSFRRGRPCKTDSPDVREIRHRKTLSERQNGHQNAGHERRFSGRPYVMLLSGQIVVASLGVPSGRTQVTPHSFRLHVHTQAAKFQMALCRAHSHKKLMQLDRKVLRRRYIRHSRHSARGKLVSFMTHKTVRVIRR